MIDSRLRKWMAGGILVPFLAVQGCGGGWTTLDREELTSPEPAPSYRVTTRDDRVLTFIDLHLEGDTLVGTVRRTAEETVGEGDAARRVVSNRYDEVRLPWSDVATVEAQRSGKVASDYLLVAGAIGAGVIAFLLLSNTSDTAPHAGGNGK
jgi:hypothetical protein